MKSTNKITIMHINLDDYNFMREELERLTTENKRLKEEIETHKAEAFRLQREQWRVE